jgi:hypothetical protein
MKIYPDFSEITQIKMCLSSINHEDEYISLLHISIKINITEECTQVYHTVKEQAFNFMWDGINCKKGVNILLTNNR